VSIYELAELAGMLSAYVFIAYLIWKYIIKKIFFKDKEDKEKKEDIWEDKKKEKSNG